MAIIDRQLPFEYTIASKSTDVMVMALPIVNINHSAFRSMFDREKLSGTNFNDWFRPLKLVLRVEKKLFVIEQPIPPALHADSSVQVLVQWNAVYNAHNEVVTTHNFSNTPGYYTVATYFGSVTEVACLMLRSMTPELLRQFENYSSYEMLQELKSMFEKQGYVEQLERLGYVLPQDLSVGLIMNGLTGDFAGFHLAKDDACHHYKEVGHCKRNRPAYLAELIKEEEEASWHCQFFKYLSAIRILNMVPTKKVDKTPYELWYEKVPNLSNLNVWGCEALVKRDTSDILQQISVKCIFIGFLKETMSYNFYFPPENKIVVATHGYAVSSLMDTTYWSSE
ncbi:hypothetical protein Tco_0859265 [Tanacetum coccineum]|uniref:Uncharacterized protein n=1 Tax=Tanacetum coccineum TaxID=301880 RepID=A0ABQ5BEH7_9ASTR